MIALRFSFSASGQLTTADSGPFSWLWLVNRIEDVSKLETGAVPELFSLVLTVFLSSGFLRHPFLLETACKWTSIADLNGHSLLCSLCSPRWWHRRWACRRHRRKSRASRERREHQTAKGKRKTNWNCGVLIGQRNIFTKLQNLSILLLSNHGTAEKNSGMFQNVDNRSETGENSSRASMFQCPGGPGLLPAFKMLKIEPRIPSKWLIVVQTENCWRLFKRV